MIITDQKEYIKCKLETIKPGECFKDADGDLYIKGNTLNFGWYKCIGLRKGSVVDISGEEFVIPINAKVVIE